MQFIFTHTEIAASSSFSQKLFRELLTESAISQNIYVALTKTQDGSGSEGHLVLMALIEQAKRLDDLETLTLVDQPDGVSTYLTNVAMVVDVNEELMLELTHSMDRHATMIAKGIGMLVSAGRFLASASKALVGDMTSIFAARGMVEKSDK